MRPQTSQAQDDLEPEMPDALTPEELAQQWEEEAPERSGPIANLASSIVVIALGAAGSVLSLALGIGTVTDPRPGTWPLAVGVLLVILGVAQLILGRRGGTDGEKFTFNSLYALAGLVTLFAIAWLMPIIGFEIPALAMSIVWMKFLGGESWRSAVLYSVIVVAVFYAIFIMALGTSIPHLI